MFDIFISPFVDFSFMLNALLACIVICFSAIPIGAFMVLRRMSLTGDAIAHSILPGVAIAYLLFGFSLLSMTLGGLIAGLLVVLFSGIITRHTHIKEDANLAVFYLLSLALGVIILSNHAGQVDLFHLLFGSILALDSPTLNTLFILSFISISTFITIYRPLMLDSLDPLFLRSISQHGTMAYYVFLVLVVVNLLAGFYALGTLMAVGIMILPVACAKFWVHNLKPLILIAILIGLSTCYSGLLISYYYDLAAAPAIILVLGVCYLLSILLGRHQGVIYRYFSKTHLTG